MELKKSPKANLENKKGLFIEIGLACALLATIGGFGMTQSEKVIEKIDMQIPEVEEEIIEITREDDPRPLVAAKQTVIVVSDILNIVKDDAKITEDLTFDDFDEDAAMVTSIQSGRTEGPANTSDEPFIVVEDMPKFQGGDINTFRKWLNGKIEYPDLAREHGITGQVIVEFVIEKDGSLGGINVLKSPDKSLSAEVIKVLKQSPKWTPGKQRKVPARVKFTLPVDFVAGM